MLRPDLNNPRLGFKFDRPELKIKDGGEDEAILVTHSSSLPTVTIDTIREKLKNGDLSALADLDSLKCPYEKIEKDGGYTIEFTYDGAKYTITYFGETKDPGKAEDPDVTPPKDESTPPEEPETNPERPVVTTPPEDPVDKTPPEGDGGSKEATEEEQIKALEGTLIELAAIYTDTTGKRYVVVKEKNITGNRETERIFIQTEEGLKEVKNAEIKDGKLVAKEGLEIEISDTITKAADIQADYDAKVKAQKEEAEQIEALEGTVLETLPSIYTDENGKQYEVVREKKITGDRETERIFIKTEEGLKEVINGEIKDGKLVAKEGLKLQISSTVTKAADVQADYDVQVKSVQEEAEQIKALEGTLIETLAVTYTDETGNEYEVVREKNVTGDRSSERIFIKTEDGLKEVKNA